MNNPLRLSLKLLLVFLLLVQTPLSVKATEQNIELNEVGVFEDCRWPMDLYLKDDKLYIADYYAGLIIVDVSDPTMPVELGRFFDGGNGHSVDVFGDFAYVADWEDGLEIIDVSDSSDPAEVGQFNDGGMVLDVSVSGDLAFVADSSNGLEVLDISDPANPILIRLMYEGGASHVRVQDDVVMVSVYNTGFYTLRISDMDVAEMGFSEDGGDAYYLAVDDRYVVTASGNVGARVIDVSDPVNPVQVGVFRESGVCYGVDVKDDLLFLADHTEGLAVADISDVRDIELMGTYDDGSDVYVVKSRGDLVFLGTKPNGVKILKMTILGETEESIPQINGFPMISLLLGLLVIWRRMNSSHVTFDTM
jgi:hypothetical protein